MTRPTGIELLRAVQGAVGEILAPEIRSPHAEEAARTVAMMLEALASEWDTAAQDLVNDTEELERILGLARDQLASLKGNESAASLVTDIDGVIGGSKPGGLKLSDLSARHTDLNQMLERTLVSIESGAIDLPEVRAAAYAHLREVAARGWSFWDAASFRERMQQIRASQGA
jgi:hypothetical protein